MTSNPDTPLPLRSLARLGAASALAVATALVCASPASAAEPSYVRLAHLSPNTTDVDVYLTSFARPDWRLTLEGVGYGTLSPYQRLQPDLYAVSMRAAGAPPTSPPILSINVRTTAGQAYTVAAVGPYASLGATLLHDDLRLPPMGRARVRVVQASAKAKTVAVTMGDGVETAPVTGESVDREKPVVGKPVGFAETSDYATVPAGTWTLRVRSTAQADLQTTVPVTLNPGDVYTVLVLDSDAGGLKVETRTDARSMAVTPVGGVETGAGGTSTPAGGTDPWLPVGLATAAALLAAAALRSARRLTPRRPTLRHPLPRRRPLPRRS